MTNISSNQAPTKIQVRVLRCSQGQNHSLFSLKHLNHHRIYNQEIHFELGRSIIAQCGSLISKVLYVKEGKNRKFIILDAGMNNLLRPALYQAFHKIENISSHLTEEKYDVVGPVCESADCFGKDLSLNATRRGDIIVIHSCGAYGEAMESRYNLRNITGKVYSR